MSESTFKQLQYVVEYAALRFVAAAYGAMPVEFASAFCGKTWRYLAPWFYRHQRAVENLQRAYPEKTHEQCDAIARDMWENLGRIFAEAFHLKRIAEGGRIEVAHPQLLDAVRESGKGAVFCAAHLGNWELSPYGMVQHGVGPASIYQKIKNPLVERYVLEKRAFLHPGGLFPKDRNAVRLLTKHAREGGIAGVLTDMREFSGVDIDFFGAAAPTTPFPAHLALSLNLPLFVLIMVRKPGVRFICQVEKIDVQKTANKRADILAATAQIHAVIERAIRAHPAQWMWGHRRWG